MSTLKRKDAPGGDPPAKSAKKAKEARPAKKDEATKSAKSPGKASDKPASSTDTRPKESVVSMLKEEEPLFPRGGGSVLTPLEQKQINLEAKADAARDEEFTTATKTQKKKKRQTNLKTEKKGSKREKEEDSVKVESLSFKRLVKGSLVLGQVTRVNNLDLEVALPNNLVGHVSIVAVSEQLTKRLEADAAADAGDAEDDDNDSSNDNDVNLKSLFVTGQYLRVYVVSTMDDTVIGKGKRKIELSLRPAEANSGLGIDDVVAHSTIMASVVSVEERGCVMDVGIPDMRAFLPKNEIEPTIDEERLQPGAVFLCQVTGKKSGGKTAQLSLLQKKLGNVKEVPSDATTLNTYLPGTTVDLLVTNTDRRGLAGKIMGHLDATADVIHSGVGTNAVDLASTYKIGSRVKARVICNFPTAKEPKLGVSLLPHVTALTRKQPTKANNKKLPTDVLPISSMVEECTVRHVEAEIGLFVDLGIPGLSGFVHISRVKDGKVDALYESSGPYKAGSTHKGRVIGYNEVDGMFQISLQKSVLEQPFIRIEDVPVGAVLNCEVEKVVINEEGVAGLIMKIAEGISGFVQERHLSDVKLQHPEKKFREGLKLKARVLSLNLSRKRIRLTLKKTLVNSELPVIKSYDEVSVGMQVLGTIMKLQSNGAHIQFYGSLRGFLPISEMSEAYIRDASEHFRVGQVVSMHVLDVDSEQRRLVVSCKDPTAFGLDKQNALKNLKVGELVSGKVSQKTDDQVFIELADNQLRAILSVGHLTDKSTSKNEYALKRISVGQTLSSLMVIDKDEKRRAIILTQKPSLVEASKEGKLLTKFEDAKEGAVVPGFVRNITQTAVFVQFAGNVHALLPKSRLPADVQSLTDFGMHKYQSIEVRVVSLIPDMRRIMVAPASADEDAAKPSKSEKPAPTDNLVLGSVARAKVTSVKETQLNVQIVDTETQGRIDVSQIYDSWDEISDPSDPLDKFTKKQIVRVRVMGVHDAKDHRFLPISHRSAHSVLELTAKPSDFKTETLEPLSLDKLQVGETHLAFVNNVSPQFLWVNLSPSVRGRISAMEASDDLSQLSDLEANFPIGSALKVRVTAVDVKNNRLDLSARSGTADAVTWSSLKKNMVLPGKITKVNERQVLIKLSESVSGPVHLPDMVDNYDDVNTLNHKKNDIVRVSVVELDVSNKRLRLSTRPSRIMSSTLPVVDKEITDITQVSQGDIVRGFVKNVSDKGLFVLLGGQVTALVKIANLSDRFLKEWKDQFQIDQLVKGRVIAVDAATKHVELSLKSSVVDEDYKPLLAINDIKEGQIVTGKVRKVEEFGAFIVLDNSANVSGLCHRSQMAEKPVPDATKLYQEGDMVKALVLEVDAKKKRISFSLKPSLIDEEDSDSDSDAGAALDDAEEDSDIDAEDIDMDDGVSIDILGTDNVEISGDSEEDEDNNEDEDEDDDVEMEDQPQTKTKGLSAGKKADWSADPFGDSGPESDDGAKGDKEKKKKRKKGETHVDKTAELDVNGPQTSSDYERLLLGQPDSSELWIAYMAFQMQVSDLSKAREVAERAIKSINIREETEKLNVWVAYLNLEVAYGTKETVDEVFKRACQYNDEQEIHERLASIYIQSEKLRRADDLFEVMVKKFGARAPSVWNNYAHYLHVTRNDPAKARALLPRATQQLEKQHSQNIVSRFAALEFRSPNGEPERGRTMFEGLLAAWPKKGDLWNQLLDLETGMANADPTAVRDVFERRTRVKGLKPQQAEKWFRRWAAWEEKLDPKGKDKVMAKAQEWAGSFKARKEAEAAAQEDEEMEE
ncbi:ribosomal RNA processing RRP5 [Paramyrothecium foliicola]|nr:ribosomal RNA processing RRP5 [Paramyrothecium foliicola]